MHPLIARAALLVHEIRTQGWSPDRLDRLDAVMAELAAIPGPLPGERGLARLIGALPL